MTAREIEQVLDEQVRPQLAEHGGNVELVDFDELGTVRLRLIGHCSGCPAASVTNELLIQAALTGALTQVKWAVLVDQVSEDLLAQARSLLAHSASKA